MKKLFILFLFLALSFGFGLNYVSAQEEVIIQNEAAIQDEAVAQEATDQEIEQVAEVADAVAVEEEITVQDLEVENPGLLPTSRFYFLKNWTRAARRVLTFNPVKKAELELEIVNQQAAEIKAIEKAAPERIDAISKAAENYQTNMDRLKNRLESLKETSENPNVDKLLEKLADRSVKHQQLFDELKQKFEDKNNLEQKFSQMQEKVSEAVAKIPEKFENAEAFKERMQRVLESQPERKFKELRDIEVIDRIGGKLTEEQRAQFESVRENILNNFKNRIEALPEAERKEILMPKILEKLPGDPQLRLKILEEFKNRFKNPEIIEGLSEAKEAILESQVEKMEIRKETVEKIITEVKSLIARAEGALATGSSAEVKEALKKLLTVSKNQLAEAEKSLAEDKIGEAFGRAIAAQATAQNALKQVMVRPLLQQIPIQPKAVIQQNNTVLPSTTQSAGSTESVGTIQPQVNVQTQTGEMTGIKMIQPQSILDIGKCGDGVCGPIEREKGICAIDCR